MRKIILAAVALSLCFSFPLKTSGEELTFNESDAFSETPSDYVPAEIDEILKNENIAPSENLDLNFVFSKLKDCFKDRVIIYTRLLSLLITISLLFSVLKSLQHNNSNNTKVFIVTLSLTSTIITYIKPIIALCNTTLSSFNDILTALIPSIASSYLLTNSTFTSIASSSSLMLILSISEQIFERLLFPATTILLSLLTVEQISPQLKEIGVTKSLKKSLLSLLTFVFSLLLSFISLNGTLAASKDSLSSRTLKFTAANIIPIIGSSVGDALKTVTAGAAYIKRYIGITTSYALLITALPVFAELFLIKITLRLSSLVASLTGGEEASRLIDGFCDIADILLAIITATTATTYFSIILFSHITISI